MVLHPIMLAVATTYNAGGGVVYTRGNYAGTEDGWGAWYVTRTVTSTTNTSGGSGGAGGVSRLWRICCKWF